MPPTHLYSLLWWLWVFLRQQVGNIRIRRVSRAILLAGFSNLAANLAHCRGEREVMAVRLMSRHLGYQDLEVVGHTLLRKLHSMRYRNERSSGHAYIKDVSK